MLNWAQIVWSLNTLSGKMKKIFIIAVVCILALGTAGCQSTNHSDNFVVKEVTASVEHLEGETPYMADEFRRFGDYWVNLFTW